MNIFQHRFLIISLGILVIAIILLLVFRFFSKTVPQTLQPTPIPTQPISTPIQVGLPTSSESQTGADIEAEKEFLEENPQYLIEANLKSEVPIRKDGFEVDFSYSENKFTATIFQPNSDNYNKFLSWMREVGLTDIGRFIITYK